MKIGSDPDRDPARVAAAKQAIGSAGLFVDANGAYGRKQAQRLAQTFRARAGRAVVRGAGVLGRSRRACGTCATQRRATMEIAAGEYGYTLDYFRRMLEAGAVDVQQADATRCGGVTGFMQAAALCEAYHTDLSAHCAPALHRHLGCAAPRFRHVEWFHDHVRIEQMLFDGAPGAARTAPSRRTSSRPGLGLTLKRRDAERFAVARRRRE